ncbi:MAG: hypothetical protein AABX76_01080 [Nanoarchaeota archaeon]
MSIDFSGCTPQQLAYYNFYGSPNRDVEATWQAPTQGMNNLRRDLETYLAKMPMDFNLEFERLRRVESELLSSKDSFGRPGSIEDGSLNDLCQ